MQQETLVHIISILNVMSYAAQVNRHSINTLMDKVDETVHDVNNLQFDHLTSDQSQFSPVNTSHQVSLSKPSGFPIIHQNNFYAHYGLHRCSYNWDTLPHVLPITDLQNMLSHIEETLPPTLHLPVSSEDTLNFYRYLCTHLLITSKQFYSL